MKRYYHPVLNLALMLIAALFFIGCGDKLLPPNGNDSTNTQKDPNKITLKGELMLEAPLPDDAKVVLLWVTKTDYYYIRERGTIDRVNNTFEIELNQAPPVLSLLNAGGSDLEFGCGLIVVLPESAPENYGFYDWTDIFDTVYGGVDLSSVIYFDVDPSSQWISGSDDCRDWVKQFGAGYRMGKGIERKNGCTFQGFKPIPSTGLTLIITTDRQRLETVNWT